jgi:hypothetical protein
MATGAEKLQATIEKLEEKVQGLANFIAAEIVGDGDEEIVWDDSLDEIGNEPVTLWAFRDRSNAA